MNSDAEKGRDRLYQELARKLIEEFSSGRYQPGDRLPAERELSQIHHVSRPTVREAIIALEVQGIIEVKVGSGAFLKRLPNGALDPPSFSVSAFELTEARLLLEGEAAALAASQITEEELAALDRLVAEIARENERNEGTEKADREFHLQIARATRNGALVHLVELLWNLRGQSPESALHYAKARAAEVKPVVDEHTAIVGALRTRDPARARKAMHAHLGAVMDSLLFAIEEQAIAEARAASKTRRDRYTRTIT